MNAPASVNKPTVLVESSHDLPLVSVSVATKTGSLFDPAELEGLTRLTSRLMRRTGGGRDAQQIDTQIDALGGSLAAEVSASATSFSGTVIRRSLEPYLDLLGDVLARPGLADEELGRLQRESHAELVEALDDDRGLARRWFRKYMFEGHPYGRPVSGVSSSISRIAKADVAACAKRLVAREGLIIAFSGDLTHDEAEHHAEKLFAALPSGSPPVDATTDPAPRAGRRLIIVDKPERTQTQILIGGTGTHASDPDHTALLVGNTIFGGTFTARMTQEVRSKRGWSYGAYSSLPIDRRRQAFSMWTFPKAEDAAPCVTLELDMLRALREKGVTKKELSWAKRYLTRSHAFAIDTPAKRVGLALDARLYDLPENYYEQYLARVAAASLDDVNKALLERLPEKDLLIVVVGTASTIRAPLEAAIPDLSAVEVVKFDTEV
ncbi:MAG TPA: pitrilysin family protein [Polyangiaceae bacterium]|nr:pitrilysin family protein [Polyangiaceae bacterium]